MNRRGFFGGLVGGLLVLLGCKPAQKKPTASIAWRNSAVPEFKVTLSEEYMDPDTAALERMYAKWFAQFQVPNAAPLYIVTRKEV